MNITKLKCSSPLLLCTLLSSVAASCPRRRMPLCVIAALFALSPLFAPSIPAETLILHPDQREAQLAPYLEILSQPDTSWTITDVSSAPISAGFKQNDSGRIPRRGTRTVWLRFSVANDAGQSEWIILLGSRSFQRMDLFIQESGLDTGEWIHRALEASKLFEQREVPAVVGAFSLPLSETPTTFYLKMAWEREATESPWVLFKSREKFLEDKLILFVLIGMFLGLALGMLSLIHI